MSIIPTLRDSAALVNVSLSVWSARKLDSKQTAKAIKAAGATDDGGRFNKHLLASADESLRLVARKAKAIRTFIEDNSMPWDNAGNRIVSNHRMLTMVGELDALEKDFYAAVDAFVDEYPILRAQALSNLGDMANAEDYPVPSAVRAKFSMQVEFQPIPQNFNDVRMGMTPEQCAAFQKHFEDNVSRQVASSVRKAWERLRENLQRYSTNLDLRDDDSGKMKVFRDSMVEQLRDTIALLRDLGQFGDPELEKIVQKVEQDVTRFDAGQLRASPATSVGVKAQVDAILKNMQVYLGDQN